MSKPPISDVVVSKQDLSVPQYGRPNRIKVFLGLENGVSRLDDQTAGFSRAS